MPIPIEEFKVGQAWGWKTSRLEDAWCIVGINNGKFRLELIRFVIVNRNRQAIRDRNPSGFDEAANVWAERPADEWVHIPIADREDLLEKPILPVITLPDGDRLSLITE